MATVTFMPGPGDADCVRWLGHSFAAGEPVEIEDAATVERIRRNRFFVVDDDGEPETGPVEPELDTGAHDGEPETGGLALKHLGRGRYAVYQGDERLTPDPLTKAEAEAFMAAYEPQESQE